MKIPRNTFFGFSLFKRKHHESSKNLHTLIRVFAGFSKAEGAVLEDDIDSTLGFLRHDFTETIYSELQEIFRKALSEAQDLDQIAYELARQLGVEEKILLGVQLYVLISRAEAKQEQLVSFYRFMTNLGVASEAIDIVYQLDTENTPFRTDHGEDPTNPLEAIRVASKQPADLTLRSLSPEAGFIAFRFRELILIKNTGACEIAARGRPLKPGEFCRLYDGQRVIIEDTVVTYADLVFYLNARKEVSTILLFASVVDGPDTTIRIERRRSRQSTLELRFGLEVSILALKKTTATVNGQALIPGEKIHAALDDSIELTGGACVSLLELRRRAREFGGQFELEISRPDYLVSNNPSLLRPGDILLAQAVRGDILLRIECDYLNKKGRLEVKRSDWPVVVDNEPVRGSCELRDGNSIVIGPGHFLVCDFSEGIIEEQRTVIRSLELSQVNQNFGREQVLEGISLKANRGDLICIMGPSGCGKSTLLRMIAGQLKPTRGKVLLNEASLYDHRDSLSPFIAFMPQEDTYDPLLKVGENITTSAAIRCPHLPLKERRKRAGAKLVELGLYEQRGRLAGTAATKLLSGGERKRLNVGLDMVAISDVFLFDEPTSGLSSKDSEHILEIIRGLAHNKIVFVSIHQPSARLFRMFDKALLLDRGGRMVFYGSPQAMMDYFTEAAKEQSARAPGKDEPRDRLLQVTQPEEIFDVLETPLRDPGGNILYERDSRGHLVPARRYTPDFWRDRFAAHSMAEEVESISDVAHQSTEGEAPAINIPTPPARTIRDELVILWTLVRRAFLSKLRSRGNLAATFLMAPGLALLIATVLRYSEDGDYNLASALHIPRYLFLSLLVGMFLGLTNSADDILRDRAALIRERNHRIRHGFYIASKLVSLGFFGLIQCAIYLALGNSILEIHSMFGLFLLWMFLTTLIGICLGLLVSCVVSDPKTALNAIPLILIPQVILGGALIKYEEMNRNLDLVYSLRRWMDPQEEKAAAVGQPPSRLKVPFICQFMPLRWSYEAIVLSQAQLNPRTRAQNLLTREIKALSRLDEEQKATEEISTRLHNTKQALAFVTGMEGADTGDAITKLRDLMLSIKLGNFDPDNPRWSEYGKVSTEQIFVNETLQDLVTHAEIERTDYRQGNKSPNVFLGTEKRLLGITVNTLAIDFVVLLLFVVLTIATLHVILSRQLDRT
jgi:ABC-type multidrug transport system ATPase subunit